MSSFDINLIIAIIGTISSVAALLWAIFTFLIPYFEDKQKSKQDSEKKLLGPYTINMIEDAAKYYVYPKCSKNDPNQLQNTEILSEKLYLFSEVKNFLNSGEKTKFLLVLADSGMGKTSFILNYYHQNRRKPKKKREKIKLVSLSVPNAEAYIVDAEEDYENQVIFLDAFDEDTKAINNYKVRLLQLLRLCSRYKKVIITCRSQFFIRESDIPSTSEIPIIGAAYAGSKKQYEITKLYLLPFTTEDINIYLEKRYPKLNKEKKQLTVSIVSRIPSLSMRPMLLAYIPELLESKNTVNTTYSLFELIIDGWLERETVWVEKKSLQEFSEKLAVDIFQNREKRGSESVSKEDLVSFSERWGIKIEKWKLTGRSLLNRDSQDNYKFAHRSIMEFLFIKRLFKKDPDCYWIEITDQMITFVGERFGWTERAKTIFGKKIKFLSADLLWKIVDMKENIPEEKYLMFSRIFDGIMFLELTGILLTSLHDRGDTKLKNIGSLGIEFDKIIEKENLGILSVRKNLSNSLALNFHKSKNPTMDFFEDISEYLGEQLIVKKSIIRDALMFKTPNEVFLLQLKNYMKYFEEMPSNKSIVDLLSENINLYKNKVLAVPLFDAENKFNNYVIIMF